jgi:glycine cleavage system H protein
MTLRFTKDHEWIRTEDTQSGTATVGITDYAQAQLGDIVYVELPSAGQSIDQGNEAAVVESVKAASEIYAPVTGTIIEANAELESQPSLVNSEPEAGAWFFKVKLANPAELDALMDEAAYKEYLQGLAA